MSNTTTAYLTEGDNSMYAGADGKVVPVVTRAGEEDANTAQSGDCIRVSGVSIQHTPATKIWFGQVSNTPGYRSLPHHHGEAETGGYVLRGHGRIYYGENFSEYQDMKAKFGSKSRTARLAVVPGAVVVLSRATAATAMANPAIYWGQTRSPVRRRRLPHVLRPRCLAQRAESLLGPSAEGSI